MYKAFEVITKSSDSNARVGMLNTAHGKVDTPIFMPIGTRAAVKGLTPKQLLETKSEMLLANTYHLYLRPGLETVEKLGRIHKIMSWDGPILTDSGGFQVFSLASLSKIDDKGVEFASHIDGKKIYLDPKEATIAQNRIGADVIMCFDECAPYPCDKKQLEKAVNRTTQWAKICRDTHDNTHQLIFAIVQGGIEKDLRQKSAQELTELDFDGYAIGGLSVGEGHEKMIATTEYTSPLLPADKPRYLMGVGMPADIIASVKAGVDMFDCVLPTRNGRNALAFTDQGPIRMRNSFLTDDTGPIEKDCDCYACTEFSRGAIRHFFNVKEMLGPILTSIHNIRYYQRLMSTIREKIRNDVFSQWADREIKRLVNIYS